MRGLARSVIPAKAGIQRAKRRKKTTTVVSAKALVAFAPFRRELDTGFRRYDEIARALTPPIET